MKTSITKIISGGHQRWLLDYSISGKRIKRTFRVKAEAEAASRTAKLEMEQGGAYWVSLTASQRSEIISVIGEVRDSGMTLSDVWGRYKAMTSITGGSSTLNAAVAECLGHKKKAGRRRDYVTALRQAFTRFTAGRGSQKIGSVSTEEVEAWLAATANGSDSSRDTYIARINVLFSFAKRRGWVPVNPVDAVERGTSDQSTPLILKVDQCRKILEWTKANRANRIDWLAVSLFCGVRPAETEWLTPDSFRGPSLHISSAASKVRERRITPISDNALLWMNKKPRLPLRRSSRVRFVRELRDVVGFKEWPKDVLRHTTASHMLALHKDAQRVSLELGNSPKVLLRHYRELVTDRQCQEFWSLSP